MKIKELLLPTVTILAIASFLFFSRPEPGVSQHGEEGHRSMTFVGQTYAEETVGTLTAELFENVSTTYPRTNLVYFVVEDYAIRIRWDGGTPTATTGIPVAVGESFEVVGYTDINNAKMIGSGAGTSTMHCMYSGQEAMKDQ